MGLVLLRSNPVVKDFRLLIGSCGNGVRQKLQRQSYALSTAVAEAHQPGQTERVLERWTSAVKVAGR